MSKLVAQHSTPFKTFAESEKKTLLYREVEQKSFPILLTSTAKVVSAEN